jgi:DNA-directed RNA polymerase specialized sigma24 family protein
VTERSAAPVLPEGVDSQEYERIRVRMRMSVLKVWKSDQMIAGMDPWSVVDEAWASMAESGFTSAGPFEPFALRVAHNKAVDVLNKAEAKRHHRSLEAPITDSTDVSLEDVLPGSAGADEEYFSELRHQKDVELLTLAEEAIDAVLTPVEREVFLAVQYHRKSCVAVGRELDRPVTGQRVGQIVAAATAKIHSYIEEHGQEHER